MKTHLQALISDLELDKGLIENIKNRDIDPKYVYLGEGASRYYKAYENSQFGSKQMNYFEFIGKHINKKENTAIISMGCGNASQEKNLLIKLQKDGYNFSYFAVDISREMLTLAKENLREIQIDKHFIVADVMSEDFRQEIMRFTKGHDRRLFCFLGRTFCNATQTNVVDSFYNLLKTDDLLWFDVYTRKDNTKKTQLKIFTRYKEYLQEKNIAKLNFQFNVLNKLGIENDSGIFTLKTEEENSTGALKFSFGFKFSQKETILFRNERISILTGEVISLYDIRNYYEEDFLEFFKQHGFKTEDKISKDYLEGWLFYSQFLFKREAE